MDAIFLAGRGEDQEAAPMHEVLWGLARNRNWEHLGDGPNLSWEMGRKHLMRVEEREMGMVVTTADVVVDGEKDAVVGAQRRLMGCLAEMVMARAGMDGLGRPGRASANV